MNYYTFIVKTGKQKNRIIAECFANTRKEALERQKQALIDAGVYVEAAGYVFTRNFVIKARKDV